MHISRIVLYIYFNLLSTFISHILCLAPGRDVTNTKDEIMRLVKNHNIWQNEFLHRFKQMHFSDKDRAMSVFIHEHYKYSQNFVRYLEIVKSKMDDKSILSLIDENLNEENGNYQKDDIDTLLKSGIPEEHYNGIPHRILMKRLVKSVSSLKYTQEEDNLSPGDLFTNFMLDTLNNSSGCVCTAVIGFAIESTVSKLYNYIWKGFQKSSKKPFDYVFLPLHILVDDNHADDLIKSYEILFNNNSIECDGSLVTVKRILDERVLFFNRILTIIDGYDVGKNGQTCKVNKIKEAKKKINENMVFENYNLKEKMILSSRILDFYNHADSVSGQITCKQLSKSGNFGMYTLRYGVGMDEATLKDVIYVNKDLESENESDFPNPATIFHSTIYKERPDTNCIIHTHPKWSSILGMIDEIPSFDHMDLMGLYEHVAHLRSWPGVPFSHDEADVILSVLGDKYMAAILANHGNIVLGKTIEEVLYRAIILEKASEYTVEILQTGKNVTKVDTTLATTAREWKLFNTHLNTQFHHWTRQVLKDNNDLFM
jgi:L-fuculose-phosphate aldolase